MGMCVGMCVNVCGHVYVYVYVYVAVGVAVGVGGGGVYVYVYVCVCGGDGGVLLLVFRGKILGYVRRRTTTEPFIKDVVIDHERREGEKKTPTVVVFTTNRVETVVNMPRPMHSGPC